MSVAITAFTNLRGALDALRDYEYAEFLRDCGCPPDQIEGEVEKRRSSPSNGA
jgi:hypothetical protein